jgi:hypothetical protein
MRRPAPVPGVALLGVAGALAMGGLAVVLVVALAGAAVTWWLVVAGGFACASGLALGTGRRATVGVVLGLVALGALVIAAADDPARDRRAPVPPRERLAMIGGSKAGERPARRAPAADAAGREPRPAPAALVRSYYAALDAGEFEAAWARLGPAVRARFGGLEAWRAGYGSTLGHRVEDVRVDPGGVVRHVLVAADRTPCGGRTERRFAVSWRLERRGDNLVAAELTAVTVAGVDPAAAC